MNHLHIDFETRGTAELRDCGVDIYSRHPNTDIWCMAFAFGDDEPRISGINDASKIFEHVRAGGIVVAHNAAFEFAIWNNIKAKRYGWPKLKIEQMRCTMAMAYAMALPGSLEKAAAAVGISEQKDLAGGRLMMQMAKPRSIVDGVITWWDEPEKIERLHEYCKQDVRVERALEKRILPLTTTT